MKKSKQRFSNSELIELLLCDERYRIDDDGTIWTTRNRNGSGVQAEWRRTERLDSKGYLYVRYKSGFILSHRIVYTKFNESIEGDLTVDHHDNDKTNNRPENLKLMTARENASKGHQSRSRIGNKHARKHTAAKNILRFGHETLTKRGIPRL